ncbi:UDP-4-amino-4,6-dideoxy-N-acetyl-beta-L-altrosamine N-acetyltransferase [Dethiothermospora halolimnae]|uniref:UDP-4-amino-4, 6-dideoxy-N-acetyl-beta-L-altrosamine N-acetyltransferase n=1 Tax=Dethiothermospora halolimnae TaxID=3114390 RepID=UPI003CCC15D9
MINIKSISFYNIFDLDNKYKEKLLEWRNQKFVREKMFNSDIIQKRDHYRFLKEAKKNKQKKIYIAFYDNKPFGVLNYDYFSKENSIEFGFYLIDETYINSGFGIVLEYALLEHGFNNLNLDNVHCRTKLSNNKVVNLHSKFGFETKEIYTKNVNENKIEICYQQINKVIWNKRKDKIINLLKYIMPIDNIGKLY